MSRKKKEHKKKGFTVFTYKENFEKIRALVKETDEKITNSEPVPALKKLPKKAKKNFYAVNHTAVSKIANQELRKLNAEFELNFLK